MGAMSDSDSFIRHCTKKNIQFNIKYKFVRDSYLPLSRSSRQLSFESILLVDQITVIGNEMCI